MKSPMLLVLVGILAGNLACTPRPTFNSQVSCKGNRSAPSEKSFGIVNGTEAQEQRYAFTVSLQAAGFGHFCGGSLIAPDMVLSAAHCDPEGLGNYDVVIGRHDLTVNDGMRIKVAKSTPHPNYNPNTTNNDFLLIKLSTPVTNAKLVKVNENQSLPADGSPVTVAGWGATSEGGNLSNVLLEVSVNTMSNVACQQTSANPAYSSVTDKMLCAARRDNVNYDSCQGDSGGPLIIKGASAGEDVQVGVVSWGIGCAQTGNPGVYSRISSEYNWIKTNVCSSSSMAPSSFQCPGSSVAGSTEAPLSADSVSKSDSDSSVCVASR